MIGIVPGLGKEDVVQGISTPGSPVGCAGSSPAGGRRLGRSRDALGVGNWGVPGLCLWAEAVVLLRSSRDGSAASGEAHSHPAAPLLPAQLGAKRRCLCRGAPRDPAARPRCSLRTGGIHFLAVCRVWASPCSCRGTRCWCRSSHPPALCPAARRPAGSGAVCPRGPGAGQGLSTARPGAAGLPASLLPVPGLSPLSGSDRCRRRCPSPRRRQAWRGSGGVRCEGAVCPQNPATGSGVRGQLAPLAARLSPTGSSRAPGHPQEPQGCSCRRGSWGLVVPGGGSLGTCHMVRLNPVLWLRSHRSQGSLEVWGQEEKSWQSSKTHSTTHKPPQLLPHSAPQMGPAVPGMGAVAPLGALTFPPPPQGVDEPGRASHSQQGEQNRRGHQGTPG